MELSFSKFERSFIKRLVSVKNVEDRHIQKYLLLDDYFAIEWDVECSKVLLYFKGHPSIEKQLRVWDDMCEIIFLLNKLEATRLIGIYQLKEDIKWERSIYNKDEYYYDESMHAYFEKKNKVISGGVLKDTTLISQKVSNKTMAFNSDLGKFLDKYANAMFYISSELRDMVENKFRSKEHIRFLRTQRVSIIAICVAILIALMSYVEHFIFLFDHFLYSIIKIQLNTIFMLLDTFHSL